MSDQPTQPAPVGEPTSGDQVGAYVIDGHVAQGGMATVLRVHHAVTGELFALKLLLPLALAKETQGRFRREFRALSRLHHPNVLRVYQWGLHGNRPWFTMELLEGHDLREEIAHLAELPPPDRVARAEAIVIQVARALAYVHDRGLVHRDVTPGNIFVCPDGVIKLMDFGVVKEMGADMTGVNEVIGTIAYMAPEQISSDGVDARADLYSLGAVLYLLLSGRRPFNAHTIHGFMEKHLNARERPLREVTSAVPPHLEEICHRLLAKDPRDRYASASHLLHVLGDHDHDAEHDDQWPPRTVGRTRTKSQLREAIEDIELGHPGRAMLLTGPNGIGKTRLLGLAEQNARSLGLPIVSGRCRHHDRPFGAFVSIYKALANDEPPPLLEEVFGSDDDGKVWERYPILSAFRDLLVARAPIVVSIDNLDRADPATVELLAYLIRNTIELADAPILFLLALEDGAYRVRPQLESLPAIEPLELAPLDASEVEELVVSVLESSPASLALAGRLHTEGDGSPAFISDMLRGLINEGMIARKSTGTWRLTLSEKQVRRSRLPMPDSLRQTLQDRLAPLSEDALGVGRVLALSRRRLDFDVLLDAIAFPEERVMEALDQLADAGIIEEHRTEYAEQVELVHGRFQEVLLEQIDADARRTGHRRLGEALERVHRGQTSDVVEELAHHFEHADLPPKAYRYLVLTAQRHLQRSLNQEALGFLDRAIATEPAARPFLRLDEADHRLAEVYLATSQARHALGQLAEAVDATQRAQDLARAVRDAGLESRVATELGTQLRQQGDTAAAEEQLTLAVQRAEEAGDRRLLPAALYEQGSLRWYRGDLKGAEELWQRSLQIAEQVGDERAQGHGYNGLAILAQCEGRSMDARAWLERSATLFERLGMLGPLVTARVNLIEVYSNTGTLRKALALADRTLDQAEEIAHAQGVMLGHAWRARVLLLLGRIDEAERESQDAYDQVFLLPDQHDEATVVTARVQILFAQERWKDALDHTDQLLGILAGHDSEGVTHEARAWRAFALAKLGRTADAADALEHISADAALWPHIRVRTQLALGRGLCAVGVYSEARSLLRQALATSEANGYRYFQLLAHLQLRTVVEDDVNRERHARVAAGLARSLAANLPRTDAARFLAAHTVRPPR